MSNLVKHVADGKKVKFLHYQDGVLWYETELGLQFPVECSDTGSGIFLNEDRAILYLRWIRKHLAFVEKSRIEQTNE